eukprot:gnl/TRDRNA2_/TRDRNA2_64421_c0_seq1.p1 gnl/TRDRNA2_/TRDRNA2_64421_c0~~gnl/TRDRNA2_/TRDRNA2_64421_c0_seq1.p1  ORF type:complete len:151 (-),score=14.29 gnl/TRDRNA2_/TRDRNA2_64421_c0_seq1:385-774(-)
MWIEENGRIMEKPEFPLAPGRYLLEWLNQESASEGSPTAVLTINSDGDSWELSNGATLYHVTHLPCRSARYKPAHADASPRNAHASDFPVTPGDVMPSVPGYDKQDYAVLFVAGLERKSSEVQDTYLYA